MVATRLHQGHRLLQRLARAQNLQAVALKAWKTAVDTAASQAEQALTPAAWFERSQAALQSMLRPWGAMACADDQGR